uniref:Developmentally regulated GTP binding protein 1 n=1 Tax=Monodelphis domestica TaxID=13616 RepID=A0A5F8GRX9_MONDO
MSGTLAKIAEIEAEMARTQKNKATAHHLGLLKARLAKLRRELITPKGGGGGGPGEAPRSPRDHRRCQRWEGPRPSSHCRYVKKPACRNAFV